ncbi:MAG TPA: RIP metalloprotease [Acidimicrobiales bacterium]|nr:RIP metalloprotease [Acidimicrobiales bacterium]
MTQTAEAPPPPSRPPAAPVMDPSEQRSALVRLLLIVVGAFVAATVAGVAKTVLVVLALILMIMLHEAGHFVMAKVAGMKVTEFFLGFGPRLWSIRKGETEYGIKAIPAGGYVKIIGMSSFEEVAPEDEPRTYRQKGFWQRLGVAVAGSAVHFILAFLLLFSLFTFVGVPDDSHPQPVVNTITALNNGQSSPAQQAGFKPGDRIVSVDGRPVNTWDDLPTYIRAHPGQPIHFEVVRNGQRLTLTATPVDLSQIKVDGKPVVDQPTGFIGIGPKIPVKRYDPLSGAGHAATGLGRLAVDTVSAIGHIFSPSGVSSYASELTGRSSPRNSSGGEVRFLSPVGFVQVAGQAAQSGIRDVLTLLVLINVFVGIFNMIPLPPFDGGHVAIAIYEAVRSRKGKRYYVDGRKVMAAAYPVILLLVFIALTSLYLDIVRPLANPFR